MTTIREHEHWQHIGWLDFLKAVTKPGQQPPPATLPIGGATAFVVAYINEGRWIAECPSNDGNAFCVSSDQRWFWCPLCGNATNGGQWLGITFPPQKVAIERLLLLRPVAQNRNWRAPETLAHLRRENQAHGLEI